MYTHTTTGDPKVLDVPAPINNDSYPILREEVEAAVKSPKKGKSAGECLYNKATSAVYHDNNIGEWFRTTIGVLQGCLLSPALFIIFLERIMADALEDHEGTVSIEGGTITNLRFADDIDGLAGQRARAGQVGKTP